MPLDNNSIETLSVNAVKNSIVMSELLAQFIADNDKEPHGMDLFIFMETNLKQKVNLREECQYR
ncbi:hypothetical protein DXA91_15540 [Clostridium sp. OF09-10]|nr:hypothetical protein [Clostridium sp. OF09-10]RHV94754.1 hypothetical protein DXA91_15540 [Clostridium sp. OF09-10]